MTHIVIEARGKKEDNALELSFRRILDKNMASQMNYPVEIIFADKKTNSIGLQIADLVSYPIGRFISNPGQPNLAYKVLVEKFHKYPNYIGKGLKVFPVDPSQFS